MRRINEENVANTMKKNVARGAWVGLMLYLLSAGQGQAGIVIAGTRVLYDEGRRDVSLNISNPDKVAYLLQSWVEPEVGEEDKLPFTIIPPLFQLEGGQEYGLRILRSQRLAENKESLYWLNIKAIPSAPAKENQLLISVKTRLKLIYRPNALKAPLPASSGLLTWHYAAGELVVSNPTPYYMNFRQVQVDGHPVTATYVAPQGTVRIPLASTSVNFVTWQTLNDQGEPGEIFKRAL